MISLLLFPSFVRFLIYASVGSWLRILTIATRYSAALACRLPPLFNRNRFVLPLDAGIGQTPQIFANAASERMRVGSSPNRDRSSPSCRLVAAPVGQEIGSRPFQKIIDKLGYRRNACHQKMIAGAGACHIKQVPFGIVDLFKVSVVSDSLNSI